MPKSAAAVPLWRVHKGAYAAKRRSLTTPEHAVFLADESGPLSPSFVCAHAVRMTNTQA